MKVNILRKQVAMALLGLGCVSVLGVGSVLADDAAAATAPSTAVVAPGASVPPPPPVSTDGSGLVGEKVKIVNAVTGVKGTITSIGFHNTADNKWYDLAINKDVSSGDIPGMATIEEIGLIAGVYDKIRVGHGLIQAKGTITLTDDRGHTYVYGSQAKTGNAPLKFKKGATEEYFDVNQAKWGETDPEYTANINGEDKVGSFKDGETYYDVSQTTLEIVQGADGKLTVKNNKPIVFGIGASSYLWAGAGWKDMKFPSIDDSFVTGVVTEKDPSLTEYAEYKYMINKVEKQYGEGADKFGDDKYYISENGTTIETGFNDPIEVYGPDNELLQAVLKKERSTQKGVESNQAKSDAEYTYRQRVF